VDSAARAARAEEDSGVGARTRFARAEAVADAAAGAAGDEEGGGVGIRRKILVGVPFGWWDGGDVLLVMNANVRVFSDI
jgi:hypothetical protein